MPLPKKDLNLKRKEKPSDDGEPEIEEPSVSLGPIDKVIDLAFNPSREKIREMTIIDRLQAKLLPQLDIISLQWSYVIEVAIYRQDVNEYKRLYKKDRPVPPDLYGEFMYRTAQWQKSRDGKNLERATDIALAETENRSEEEEEIGADAWKE